MKKSWTVHERNRSGRSTRCRWPVCRDSLPESSPGARTALSAEPTLTEPADMAVRAPDTAGFIASVRSNSLEVLPFHKPSWVDALALRAHGLAARGRPPGMAMDRCLRRRRRRGRIYRDPVQRACLKIARDPAERDFGVGQGGEVRASPQRAVRTEPTLADGKRPDALRVFVGKAGWLRCSSVEDP